IILQGHPLRLCQVRIVGDNQDPFRASNGLDHAKSLGALKPGLAHATNRESVCGTAANSGCSFSLTEPTNLRCKESNRLKLSAELFPLSKIRVVSGTAVASPANSRKK